MKVDFQVIKRYLDGRERERDKDKLIYWFSKLEAEKDLRLQYQHYWDEFAYELDREGYDGSIVQGRIYHEIKLAESGQKKQGNRAKRMINIISKVAAVLFIPLIVFLYSGRDYFLSSTSELAYSEIYSPLGTRTMFYLPDGSKGWLNGGSYLGFPTDFRGKTKEVTLKGEAYFKVVEDRKRRLIVKGDDFEVVVHGTSFNVRAYPEDRKVSVALIEGEVAFYGKINDIKKYIGELDKDQICVYNIDNSTCSFNYVDTRKLIAWKDGKLILNEYFDEVVRKINRWYNVDLIIKDKILESYEYMATFEDETLDEVLKLLKYTAPITYKDLGRKKRDDGTFEKRKIEIYYKQ